MIVVVRLWAAALSIVVVNGEREDWRRGIVDSVGEEVEDGGEADLVEVEDASSSSHEWLG